MDSINDLVDKRRDKKENKLAFKENLQSSGLTIALSKGRYLGGYPELLDEKYGDIIVKSTGLFFQDNLNFNFIFIPVEKLLKAEFRTGEQTSKNQVLSRILAFSGFRFAFKQKDREKHMFLTVTYSENEVECSVLFESKGANKIAGAVAKIVQDNAKAKEVASDKTLIDLMKEISVLRAMNVITEEEFADKKRDILSRM
ncbi:hypothetical protein C8E03_101672 [Lachnotalea glycerini]|uniref:SHOCT domain-containing protein n=1 Tax=Lachnotalea glycerini TaxID=1763509 RepID=A0A255IM66_9FIRM|nr:hypothetical protein [Lachnotalea glycerini]PXV96039.1 hypothetical protein C8E03_101672 [Lachnotalea glycerini]RDY30573.1 hypothetical protein CG710_013930 [Lachnotalea glycerini]